MPSYSNCRMEEIANAVRGVLALRNGFAENRKLSQHLQKNIAHYDMQITGKVWSELFAKALIPFQLKCSQEEMQQVYMKYSSGQEKVDLRVFCDNFFGVSAFGSALSEPNSLQALDALRLAIQKKVRTENITFMNILKELEGTLDRDSDGFITFDEFVNGFYKCGLPLQPNQWTPSLQRALFSSLDVDGSGTISLFEFQRALRSFAINLRRTLLVKKAFESIAELNPVTNASQVTVHELRERFSVNRHPMVVKNLCTTDDVLKKFLETLGDTNSDGVLTWREFLDYYSDISLTIEFDDYFELMIRNAWHMSGGDGWCENTTCRRILVVASDGSERVVEIQDDIGISKDDLPKIYSKLQEQGIFDISEIAYCM